MNGFEDYKDYDDYEPTLEELQEQDSEARTTGDNTANQIEITFDAEGFATGIVGAVKAQLKEELYNQVVNEIKEECLANIREKIQIQSGEIVKDAIQEYINNEKIVVNDDPFGEGKREEITFGQYIKKCFKDIITNGRFKVFKSLERDSWMRGGYRFKYDDYSFEEYIQANCGVDNEIKKYLDEQVDKMRKEINKNVKNTFDEATRNMLSQSILNILMANDTYKKIESNIACIASKGD